MFKSEEFNLLHQTIRSLFNYENTTDELAKIYLNKYDAQLADAILNIPGAACLIAPYIDTFSKLRFILTIIHKQESIQAFTKDYPLEALSIAMSNQPLRQEELTHIAYNYPRLMDKLFNLELIDRPFYKRYLKCQFEAKFYDIATYSKAAMDTVLSSKFLSSVLHKSTRREEHQIFSKSCSAKSIMVYLHAQGLLPEKELSGKKELEIYREICNGPDEEASLPKIVDYLTQFGIKIKIYENETVLKQVLKNEIAEKRYLSETAGLPVNKFNFFNMPKKHKSCHLMIINLVDNDKTHMTYLSYDEKMKTCLFYDPAKGPAEAIDWEAIKSTSVNDNFLVIQLKTPLAPELEQSACMAASV